MILTSNYSTKDFETMLDLKRFSLSFLLAISISTALQAQVNIASIDAKKYIDQVVSICDVVSDARFLENSISKPTLLNVGGVYPNQALTIVINFESRPNFSFKPEEFYLSKKVCVTGRLVNFKGTPQIVVLSPAEIQVEEQQAIAAANVSSDNKTAAANTDTADTASEETVKAVNNKSNNSLPVSKAETKIAKTKEPAAAEVYDIKLTNDVNMRSAPGIKSPSVLVILAGSTVSILSSADGWSLVEYKHSSKEQQEVVMKGYVKNSVLK